MVFLRPNADDADGNWLNESGNNTDLFSSLDEASAGDADYIASPIYPVNEVCRIALGDPGGVLAEPFVLRYRFNNSAGATLRVRLVQGASTEIASWDETGDGWTTSERTLTTPQFAAITNFSDLFVEFRASSSVWTPGVLAVAPRMFVDCSDAVWSGSNLSSIVNRGSDGGSATVTATTKGDTLNSFSTLAFVTQSSSHLAFTLSAWSSGALAVFAVSRPDIASQDRGLLCGPGGWGSVGVSGFYAIAVATSIGDPSTALIGPWASGDGWGTLFNAGDAPALYGRANPTAAWHFQSWSLGTSNSAREDGASATFEQSKTGVVPNYSSGSWRVGTVDAAGQTLLGDIAALLVFDYHPTTDELERLEGWAAHKFGLTGILPGDHPYKSSIPTRDTTLVLDLNFLAMTSLDPRVTFSRTTVATLYDATGKLTLAPHNLARQSQGFEVPGVWPLFGGATVTANTTVAPDDTTTADTINFAAGATSEVYSIFTFVVVPYVVSVWAKVATGTQDFRIKYYNGTTNLYSSDLTATTTWQRFSFPFTGAASSGNVSVANSTAGGVKSVIFWGFQLEQYASTAGAYIPTTTTAVHGPRFDHDPFTLAPRGLLMEEQRINSCTWSEDLSNAAWLKTAATVTVDQITAPDGTLTADMVTCDTPTTASHVRKSFAWTAVAWTISIFVKKGTAPFLWMRIQDSGFASDAWFNLTTGAFTTTTGYTRTTVDVLPDGWFRVSVTRTPSAGTSNAIFGFSNADNSILTTTGQTGYFWGGQMEAGAFPTSYIPTTTVAVTRAVDVAGISGPAFSDWYNQTEGTFVVDVDPGPDVVNYLFSASNSAAPTNYLSISYSVGVAFRVDIPAGTQGTTNLGMPTANRLYKVSFGYKENDCSGSFNGAPVVPDTTVTLPTGVNQLFFVRTSTGTANPKAIRFRRLSYYNTRKSDAELVQLAAGPTVLPVLDIDFTAGTLDSKITFTRASTGTYINSSGLVASAAIDAARFNYDPITLAPRGLLLETEPRTNLCLQSNDLSVSPWTTQASVSATVTRTANAALAPDGTMTACLIASTRTATNQSAHVIQGGIVTNLGGQQGAISIWLKAKDAASVGRTLTLIDFIGILGANRVCTLTADWVRYEATAPNVGNNTHTFMLGLYAGAAPANAELGPVEFYAWGAQFEYLAPASSFIPTTTVAVTRAGDRAEMTGTNFSSWYDPLAGTFVATFDIPAIVGTREIFEANNGGLTERIIGYTSTATGNVQVVDNNANQALLNVGNVTANVQSKIAIAYTTNDARGCLNGGTIGADTAVTLPTLDRLTLGMAVTGVSYLMGHIAALKFFNVAKNNAELQALTGPRLDLDFTLMGTLDPRLTPTRTTTGTYIGHDGLLKTAAINQARLGPRGLLIEQQRTNLLLSSGDVSAAPWQTYENGIVDLTVTTNAAIAPDGTMVAAEVSCTRADVNETAERFQYLSGTAAVHAGSLWFKAKGAANIGKTVALFLWTGTAVAASKVITLTADWVRHDISGTLAVNVNCGLFFGYLGGGLIPSHTQVGLVEFYVWGAQVEAGDSASSYIPTTSAAVTRASDLVSFNDITWFNQAEGTVVQEVEQTAVTGTNAVWFFAFGSGPNSIISFNVSVHPHWVHAYVNDGVNPYFGEHIGEYQANVPFKSAVAWKANDAGAVQDGGTVATTTAVTPPTNITSIWLGQTWYGYAMHGYFKRLTYYTARKSNAELQELTS